MLTGLHAFPLTPFTDDVPDECRFAELIEHLAGSGVDAITALGSTGSYAYLDRRDRRRLIRTAVDHAGAMPVAAGIGALRTREVLAHLHDAQDAGVGAVLVAPLSYQPLTEDEVFGLFDAVCAESGVPVVVYDNPTTTGFTFSTELYGRIAQLPGIGSIKIPPTGQDLPAARARIEEVRAVIPAHVTIGISGDPSAATALAAGCDGWYSVLAGTFPQLAVPLMAAAQRGDMEQALAASQRMAPLWDFFAACGGSLRGIVALAEAAGLVGRRSLPKPLLGPTPEQVSSAGEVLETLGVRREG